MLDEKNGKEAPGTSGDVSQVGETGEHSSDKGEGVPDEPQQPAPEKEDESGAGMLNSVPGELVIAWSPIYLCHVIGEAVFAPEKEGDGPPAKPELRSISDVEALEDCLFVGEQQKQISEKLVDVNPMVGFMRVPKFLLFGKFARNIFNFRKDLGEFVHPRFLANCNDRDASGIRAIYFQLTGIKTERQYQHFSDMQQARRQLGGWMPPPSRVGNKGKLVQG